MLSNLLSDFYTDFVVAILVAAIIRLLKRSRIPINRTLTNSILGDKIRSIISRIQSVFGRKLLELSEEKLVDLLVRNPELIESGFQITERNCRRTYDGWVVEPEICGRDQGDQETIVFVIKKFDAESRSNWLETITRRVTPDCRVIFATVSHSDGTEDIQGDEFDYVRIQDNFIQLILVFVTEFYYSRVRGR